MVWLHGGGFVTGDKATPGDAQVATLLAQRGFVVLSVNYRLRPTFNGFGPGMVPAAEDAKADVQAALRWIRSNARRLDVDPFRIGVAGISAGALTAVHVGYPERPNLLTGAQSVVSISGANLLPMRTWPGSPPALFVNGTADQLVPIDAARATCARLNQDRARCQAIELPAGHDLAGYELAILTATTDHLVRTLQPDASIAFGQWLRSLGIGAPRT